MFILLVGCVEQNIVPQANTPAPDIVVYEAEPELVLVYEQEDAGRAVFAVTDAPVDMAGIHELWVTVEQVDVQIAGEGWVTVSAEEHRYDLLQLRENEELGILADVALAPGTYQQVRLSIDEVEVVDADGEHDAFLPSGELRLAAPFTIRADEATLILFDFDLSRSLHLTGAREYVLTPVIRVVAYESASVRILQTDRITIREGNPREVIVVGTSAEGTVGATEIIPQNVRITIEEGNRIVIENRTTINSTTTINNTIIVREDPIRTGEDNMTADSNMSDSDGES